MATTPTEPAISPRATMIARGLIVTKRAVEPISENRGMLRLKSRTGGYYWIPLDGSRILSGATLPSAEELQPKFIAGMERAGSFKR
jgi:hypothetical protein